MITRAALKAAGIGAAMLMGHAVFAQSNPPQPPSFTLSLKTGSFFGPGNKGVHTISNAEVRNVVLTAQAIEEIRSREIPVDTDLEFYLTDFAGRT